MTDWKSMKLDQLGTVERGRSRHRPRNDPVLYGGDYPFFQTGDVKAAEFRLTRFSQTYNEEGLAQSRLWPVGTLCITIAANIAESAILGVPGCFPDSIVAFTNDPEKSDTRFVKYLLDMTKLRMQAISGGTTQDNLSLEKLLSFDLPVPPVFVQRKIAAILAAYDELIQNNLRRIEILEEMAQVVYREWFVEFRFPGYENVKIVESEIGPIPQGWSTSQLGELAENVRSSTKAGEHLHELPYIPIDCIPAKSVTIRESKPGSEAKSSLITFEEADILFGAMRPYFHKVAIAPTRGVTRSTCFVIRPKESDYYEFTLMTLFKDETISYATNHSRGSTIPYAIWDRSLEVMPVILPPLPLAKLYGESVRPMLKLAGSLARQNTNLRATRDLLLPKLVSGEVDVSDLDIDTEWLVA